MLRRGSSSEQPSRQLVSVAAATRTLWRRRVETPTLLCAATQKAAPPTPEVQKVEEIKDGRAAGEADIFLKSLR